MANLNVPGDLHGGHHTDVPEAVVAATYDDVPVDPLGLSDCINCPVPDSADEEFTEATAQLPIAFGNVMSAGVHPAARRCPAGFHQYHRLCG